MTTTFGIYLNHPDAKIPTKANPSDAGWDIYSVEEVIIPSHKRQVVGTGIHLKMQNGWEAQLRPRSGHAAKLGLSIVNTPATIDSSYVGEIKVILYNSGEELINLPKGSKIAQMVFKEVPEITLQQLMVMPTSEERGSDGFGSSGN